LPGDYIIQVARFDPAKGIPDVVEAYAKLRKVHFEDPFHVAIPQLLMYAFFFLPLSTLFD